MVRPGTVYRRGLVSTIDLAATILELGGVSSPAAMQGRSFRVLLSNPNS